ncbi:hypothetical protein [Methylophilus sp. 5]|uniref:hypothetical protein n=1 Tax=Methylophilus sp. 5 TaxID=1112274 RepID=UPI0012F7DD52|nr:hypothetical protein [Methylophilus sp. 5]
MKSLLKVLTLLTLSTFFITSCSTTPMTKESARGIPLERVAKRALLVPQANYAQISFLRDSGIVGSAVYSSLFVDGERFAELDHGELLTIWLEPGIHTISVNMAGEKDFPKQPNDLIRSIEIDAKSERVYNFRIGWSLGQYVFEASSSPK